jgi:hypothetical protein
MTAMKTQIAIAGLLAIFGSAAFLALGGCARQTSDARTSNGGVSSATVDGGVPSSRRGVIVPSDTGLGISGTPTTGTGAGRIDDSMGKGVGGANTP